MAILNIEGPINAAGEGRFRKEGSTQNTLDFLYTLLDKEERLDGLLIRMDTPGGAAAILIGSRLMVDGGIALAHQLGIPERIIGVTIVAVGTSIPELVTTLATIRKNEHDLSAGNIIGVNSLDLSLILPLCSLASGKPLPVAPSAIPFDLPACLLITLIASPAHKGKGRKSAGIPSPRFLCCLSGGDTVKDRIEIRSLIFSSSIFPSHSFRILLYKKDFLFIRESLMKHTIEELSFNERAGRALSSQFISEHPCGQRHGYQGNHYHRQ